MSLTTTQSARTAWLGLAAPAGKPPEARGSPADTRRRDLFGGVIHEYYAAAA